MKRTMSFAAGMVSWIAVQLFLFDAVAQSKPAKTVHITLAKTEAGEPTTKFLADSPKLYAFWKGSGLKAGDRIRAVWLAENVGYSRKEAKITEASMTAYKPDDDGVFALARPQGGWPIGKYRVEMYIGDKLAEKAKFTIESDVTVEVR